MSKQQQRDFTRIVLHLTPDSYANHRSNAAFINFRLDDLTALVNLTVTRGSCIPGDYALLGGLLARFLLHHGGQRAIAPSIIQDVWPHPRRRERRPRPHP